MLRKTTLKVNKKLLEKAIESLPDLQFKFTLNQPSGNFFYDSWKIKQEYENTVWHDILKTLDFDVGEARLIKLEPGNCYVSHSDIDDRYHLNLLGTKSFLIDIDNQVMYPLVADGYWYDMDAGPRHTAANFGQRVRVQLVVRKLLIRNDLDNPVNAEIRSNIEDLEDRRFEFDDSISLWLNRANKRGIVSNFSFNKEFVSIDIEKDCIKELEDYLPLGFYLNAKVGSTNSPSLNTIA